MLHRKTPRQLVALIGAASGWGAQRRETEQGPEALRRLGVLEALQKAGLDGGWGGMVLPATPAAQRADLKPVDALPLVADHAQRLAAAVEEALAEGAFPVVIGGDHAIAAGTWSGVVAQMGAAKKFGLIWVDAHMDAHVPETSPSGAYHGMPVAALMGHGTPAMTTLAGFSGKLDPKHVVIVGARSYEDGEEALLKRLGVKVYYNDEVKARGLATVLREALTRATTGTDGFGLTIDLDAFDPADAPGVGSPEPDGLRPAEALPALAEVAAHPGLKALEVVEYNPTRDVNHRTGALAVDLLVTLLTRRLLP